MSHLFISYTRADIEFAKHLISTMQQEGIGCWYDQETATGSRWRMQIDEAINAAFAMVVLVSDKSFTSQYVIYEWAYAYGLGKTVIPLRIDGENIHPRLADFQYLDFRRSDNQPWQKLILDVRRAMSRYELPNNVIELVQDRDPDTRNRIVERIRRINDPDRLEMLREILGYPIKTDVHRKEARKAAIEAMGNLGHHAVDDLLDALRSSDNDVRFDAAGELAKMHGDDVVNGLIDALIERSAVQFSAIWALGKIADERSIKFLVPFLEDTTRSAKGKRLCDEAARALENIGTPESMEVALSFWETQLNNKERHWRHGAQTIGDYAQTKVEELTNRLKN